MAVFIVRLWHLCFPRPPMGIEYCVIEALTWSSSFETQCTWYWLSISLTIFFSFSLLYSFFDWKRGRMRLSLQGSLPATTDVWKPLFGIKTAQSFPLLLTIKILTKKSYSCTAKGSKSTFDGVFIQTAVLCLQTTPLWHRFSENDSHEQDEKVPWERFALQGASSYKDFDLSKHARESTSFGCTAEALQDQGDRNVKQPATGFTSPHYFLFSLI